MLKRGLIAKWPTETPEDLVIARAILDPMVFEDDLDAWVAEHTPSSAGETVSPSEFAARMQQSISRGAELRKKAPITACGAKLSNGEKCGQVRRNSGPAML